MLLNNIEIKVLIKGRPVTEYAHLGQTFIEGRGGSQYEIEVKNYNPFRIEAILSVDGLSVTDGKEAGTHSSGYLLDAHGSIILPGWKLSGEQVAAFAFSDKSKSYAAQSTGSSRNTGVIGLMAFAEKQKGRAISYTMNMPFYGSASPVLRSSACDGDFIMASSSVCDATAPLSQNLGTEFGEAKNFRTSTVSFDRGDLHAMVVLYYDDSKGLRQRGIVLTRPSRQHLTHQPQAFPAMGGCTPPPGWKG